MVAKRIILTSILSMAVLALFTNITLAGGIRNLPAGSAQAWLACYARYTETDAGDTVLNNPAGAPFMKDGQYFHISAMLSKNESVLEDTSTGKKYIANSFGTIPYSAYTYKSGNWAWYLSLSFPGGQGGGKFDEHPSWDYAANLVSNALGKSYTAKNQEFEFGGAKYALTLGAAFKLTDTISFGYGYRQVTTFSMGRGHATLVNSANSEPFMDLVLDYTTEGTGTGHTLSLLFKGEKFKIGLRYDPEVSIIETVKAGKKDTITQNDGEKKHNNLPAAACLGVSYRFSDSVILDTAYLYFFQKDLNGEDEPITKYWDDAWDVSAALRISLTSSVEMILGIAYVNYGLNDESYTTNDFPFATDSLTVTAGIVISPITWLKLIGGAGTSYYLSNPITNGEAKTNNLGLYKRQSNAAILAVFGLEILF